MVRQFGGGGVAVRQRCVEVSRRGEQRAAYIDFPLPTLAAELERATASPAEGPGFVLLRSVPAVRAPLLAAGPMAGAVGGPTT